MKLVLQSAVAALFHVKQPSRCSVLVQKAPRDF